MLEHAGAQIFIFEHARAHSMLEFFILDATLLVNNNWQFSDICTLRFDFESFTTAGPTATDDSTTCVDTFQVTAVSKFMYVAN